MTLKEKLFDAVFDNAWEFKTQNVIPQCEQIAEEFAIGFAEWCVLWGVTLKENKNYCYGGMNNNYTIQELLEIYKKEKQL